MDDRTVSTDALSTEFQAVVDADAAAKAAEVQRANAVTKANTLAQGALQDATAFKAFLLATFGKNAATLADFDLKPRRPTKVPVATKTDAAKKARATRQALGTKGTRQKKQAKKALADQPALTAAATEAPPAAAPAPAPTKS
jgi:ribonuclease E